MIEGRDFIFIGLQPWDIKIGSNAKDIALEVSKHNRVLYINTPLDKKTYITQRHSAEISQRKKVIQKQEPVLRQINPNLWVLDYPFTTWPVNFLPDGRLFDLINKINQKRMFLFVKTILCQLLFKDYILFIDNDIYRGFYANEFLAPALAIYYRRDHLANPYWKRHAPRLEPEFCQKVDLVVTNSIQLADDVQVYNKRTYDIGQGVDLSNYDIHIPYDIPEDIRDIPHPIVGYTGMLTTERLDINLIYLLAQKLNSFSFVFVGKEDPVFKSHPLHLLDNVHFLGIKNSHLMPNYISVFDVCMNPQAVNPTTIGNYPRKIDEYLALGKPIVATKTATMNMFKDYVSLCNDIDDYQKAILQITLKPENTAKQQERILFAQTHSWENSTNKLFQYIQQILPYEHTRVKTKDNE